MRNLFGRKLAAVRGQSPEVMIMKRSFQKQDKQQQVQMEELARKRGQGPLNNSVQGVNASLSHYAVAVKGVAGDHLWSLNLSTLPGQQRRLLSVNGLSTFLVNYAQDSYPARIDLKVSGIDGSYDVEGNPTTTIATMIPIGAAIPVYNTGGVIGYNLQYGLLGEIHSFDISHMTQLTFDLGVGADSVPVTYPLSESIVISAQITHVIM